MDGEESFDPSALGFAESVSQERVADDELIIIRVCSNSLCALLSLPPNLGMQEYENCFNCTSWCQFVHVG